MNMTSKHSAVIEKALTKRTFSFCTILYELMMFRLQKK